MDWLVGPFTCEGCDFMARALAAGALSVVTTSLIGTWVVLRGMTFMGDALAHGVIPGIAAAFLLGFDLRIGAAVSAAVMVAGIEWIGRRSRLPQDTSIGLLFVGMLSLGVVLVSLRGAYAGDLTAILFGDAIGVTASDVRGALVVAGVTTVLTVVLYRPFLALSFSQDQAQVLGLRPALAHVAMLALVALAVVASFRTVGSLLVFAFLIAPPAAASLLVRRVPAMMLVAVGLGVLAVVAGLLVSFHAGTAASPTIAGLTVVEFLLILTGRELAEARRTRRAVAAA